MTKSSILSTQAQIALDKALSRSFTMKDRAKDLIKFLYSQSSIKDDRILCTLGDIKDFKELLSQDDINVLLSEYPVVVRYCYDLISDDFEFGMAMTFKQESQIHLLPQSLVELCSDIVRLQANARVYLPFSGDMQFAHSNSSCKYFGYERNQEVWAFSQILSGAFGIQSEIICKTNILTPSVKDKYDCIFTVSLNEDRTEQAPIVNSFKNMIVHNLEDGGTFVGVFPLSFAYSPAWQGVRTMLKEDAKQYSAALIALPALLKPMSSVQLCVFVMTKNNNGSVVLLDARKKEFFAMREAYGRYDYILKSKNIVETFQMRDESNLWIGSVDELTIDADLMPGHNKAKRFVPEAGEDEQVVALGDLIEPVFCQTAKRGLGELPSITGKELSIDYLNCTLDYSDLAKEDKYKGGKVLKDDCLLALFVGGLFKMARLKDVPSEGQVLLTANIIPFRLRTDIVSEEFLLRSLSLESTISQANALACGVVIQNINHSDFSKIMIVVPSKEKQNTIYKHDSEAQFKAKDAIIQKQFNDFKQDLHMKKHAIGQNIFNLKNWWDTLLWAREEGNGIVDDNAIIGLVEKIQVKEIYKNLGYAIKELSERISKLDRGNGLVPEEFALTTFIEDFIHKNESPMFKFDYESSLHYAVTDTPGAIAKKVPIEWVKFPKEALNIIFQNIINNACSHGFSKDRKSNVVRINISSVGTNYEVTVSNNGFPISQEISKDEIFVYGRSSKTGQEHIESGEAHFGIGGYEVKNLMTQFRGDAEIISTPTEEFTVTYKLTFTQTNIIKSLSV